MLPSGLRAIEEIFLRFSKAKVKDLLLLPKEKEKKVVKKRSEEFER